MWRWLRVVQPLADGESDEIQKGAESEAEKREEEKVSFIFGERLPARRADVERVTRGEIEDGGIVRKVAGPVSPTGDESGKFSEGALAPDVEAAFLRIARRKFHHGKRERKIKRAPGDQPDYNGTCADGGGRGDPAQADAGDDVEEDQVAKTHRAARAIGRGGGFSHRRRMRMLADAWRGS